MEADFRSSYVVLIFLIGNPSTAIYHTTIEDGS